MRRIFAPVPTLDSTMPFEIEEVEYLPTADPNCCAAMVQKEDGISGKRRVVVGQEYGVSSSCGALDGAPKGPAFIVKEVTADGDTLVKKVVVPGAPGAGGELDLENLDVEALGICAEELEAGGQSERKIVAIGSSDHAPFLAAGIPSFWWKQDGDTSVPYPVHSKKDTYDKVNARYLEHSAGVIAMGAFRTANLDHLLSREILSAPAGAADDTIKPVESGAVSPCCGGKVKKVKSKVM